MTPTSSPSQPSRSTPSLPDDVDSRLLLSAIVESAHDAILSKRLDGTITSWNHGAERIYGYTAEEMIGRSITLLAPPDRPDEIPNILRRVTAGERVDHFETFRVTKDGRTIPVSLTISPLRNEQGAVVGASTIARDVSERRELERRRDEALAELQIAHQELETFTYSVSHDLRAPLRSISGFSQILAEDYGDRLDAVGLRHLERVRGAADRMGAMIDALLDLARISRAELHRQRVDVSALAQAVVRELSAAGGPVETWIAPGLEADADPRLLRIVLDNLVGNAWKFSRAMPSPRVEVTAETGDGSTWYVVRDNGVGFDPAYAAKLFLPFQRLHRTDEFTGHGIGLATVARIVRRHGGDVRADGAPGHGATFRFSLGPAG